MICLGEEFIKINFMEELYFVGQILLAIFLGGLLGWQRQGWHKPAGPRTYALVTGGSTMFTILARFGFGSLSGGSSIAAAIVTGIGFLGVGLIFHRENHVEGLTTAAGLWMSAAIGMAVGLNYYILAVLTTLIIFIVLVIDDQKFRANKALKSVEIET